MAGSSDAFTQKSSTTLSVTGTINTVDVTGTANTLAISGAAITLENGASVDGDRQQRCHHRQDGFERRCQRLRHEPRCGRHWHNGQPLTGGKVKIENGGSATINGNNDAITEIGGGSVTAMGSGITVSISGSGNSATLNQAW